MKHRITLIPGDGIGPEVTQPTLKIIKAAGVDVEWETCLEGAEALKKHGTTIPKKLLDSFNRNKVALKGPVTTPVGEGFASVNVELRRASIFTPISVRSKISPACRRAIKTST